MTTIPPERVKELRDFVQEEASWGIQGERKKQRDRYFRDLLAVLNDYEKARPLIEAVMKAPVYTLKTDIAEIDANASKFWNHEPMPGIAYIVSANRDILYAVLALREKKGEKE